MPLPLDKLNRDSLNKIIQQKEKEKDYKALGEIYGGVYNYFLYSSFKDSTILYADKAKANTYMAGDSARFYFIQLQLADFYTTSDSAIAKSYYEEALKYYLRTKNYVLQANALGGLSYMYGLRKDTANLLKYLDWAERVVKFSKDTVNIVGANDKRAHILMSRNKFDSAIILLKKNLELINHAMNFGNAENIRIFWEGLELNLLATCYYRKNNYTLAIKYAKEARQFDKQSSDLNAPNIVRYRLLINSYINTNKKDSALKYVEAFFKQTTNTLESINPEKLKEITEKYETEKKQRQISELQQQNHLQQINILTQRKLNIAFISIFFLAVISAYLIIKNIQQKRKSQLQLERQQAELAQKHALETERYRISSELHDDLGGGLSTIRLISEMVKQETTDSDTDKQLDKISESSKELIQKMNEIVWALNMNNDTLQSLIGYMRRYAVKYLDDVSINCVFKQPDAVPEIEVDGATRRNIFLLVKEALNNVVKHANATVVELTLSFNHTLQISIHDNGKGIPEQMIESSNGNGVLNMRKRVSQLNGNMQILNHEGTTVSFFIPLK